MSLDIKIRDLNQLLCQLNIYYYDKIYKSIDVKLNKHNIDTINKFIQFKINSMFLNDYEFISDYEYVKIYVDNKTIIVDRDKCVLAFKEILLIYNYYLNNY